MIETGLKLFGTVFILAAKNDKKSCMFSIEDRMSMISQACIGLFGRKVFFDCIRVRELPADTALVHAAKQLGAACLLRGVRNSQDLEYETNMLRYNELLDSSIKTVLVPSSAELAGVSSSAIKTLMSLNDTERVVKKFVPDCVYEQLVGRKYGKAIDT